MSFAWDIGAFLFLSDVSKMCTSLKGLLHWRFADSHQKNRKALYKAASCCCRDPSRCWSGSWWSCTSPSCQGSSCTFRCCRLVLARTKSVNTEFWPRLESAPRSSPSKFCSHHICISQLGGGFDDQSTPSKHNKPIKPLSSWTFLRGNRQIGRGWRDYFFRPERVHRLGWIPLLCSGLVHP